MFKIYNILLKTAWSSELKIFSNSLIVYFKPPFNYCELLEFFIAVYLFVVILAQMWTPHKKSVNIKIRSMLISVFLAAASDIYDFSEYANELEVTNHVNVNVIFCKFWIIIFYD